MRLLILIALWVSQSAFSAIQPSQSALSVEQSTEAFVAHYHQQLGSPKRCSKQEAQVVKACSDALRNDGNGPYVLHHGEATEWVVVLFHGLSDSPFYLRSVADELRAMGVTVVVGLLPGHGLTNADQAMQDAKLSEKWIAEVEQIVEIARPMGRKLMIGGFSTGGTLATRYALLNSEQVEGLILFSGAFRLSDNAEQMSRIWGMQTIAKWIDGDYQTSSRNPYKYPKVALFAVWELMEVIRQVRSLIATQPITVPTFAAHSMSDVTTPYAGVESLLAGSSAAHSLFLIDESYELCHGDLPLDKKQVKEIDYETPLDEFIELCTVPDANPLHAQMMAMLKNFISQK